MQNKLDLSKEHVTADGREIIIYNTAGGGKTPIHGAVKGFRNGEEILVPVVWTIEGKAYDARYNLVEKRHNIVKSFWFNFYSNHGTPTMHTSRESADHFVSYKKELIREACIEHHFDVPIGTGISNAA